MTERLVICTCRWRKFISQEKLSELVAHAEAEGREVEYVDDLCELIEKGDETEVSRLAKGTIAACHKRAVRSLLLWRGVEAKELIDLREGAGDTGPGDDAWYPVIDKDRCTECGKCFDFCPFGVYEMVDDLQIARTTVLPVPEIVRRRQSSSLNTVEALSMVEPNRKSRH